MCQQSVDALLPTYLAHRRTLKCQTNTPNPHAWALSLGFIFSDYGSKSHINDT